MQPLHKKPLRLSALVRHIASEFLNNGLDERFHIEVDISDEKIHVIGDERLLTRAMTNLVQNSIHHNPEGCTIWLRTSYNEGNGSCRMIVEDNGRGIAAETIPDLLELPYSTKRKQPRQQGHGLGLPMVARIAKAHHGQFILSGESGKGVRAEMVLPATTAP